MTRSWPLLTSIFAFAVVSLLSGNALARPVLSDARLLRSVGISVLAEEPMTGVGYAEVDSRGEWLLSHKAHELGRCGGYEALPARPNLKAVFTGFQRLEYRNRQYLSRHMALGLRSNPAIETALREVSEQNIQTWVQWFSSYPTRFNRGAHANDHVAALKDKLDHLVSQAHFPVQVDLIQHQSTPQRSIRVRITGASRPSEIVVLGGHMDSININSWSGDGIAPGADDNASGSADLLEALRILLTKNQPARTIDIFFYAGEETGLLGSAEIAAQYRKINANVVGVLQLDMTMFPGNGELVITSMTDFTNAWLRQYFAELNATYLNAKIVDDHCGYGCSDHASWHRNGYPTVMPFEATMNTMNPRIHTQGDVISQKSSFRHAAAFCKLSLAFAMDLGNSTATQP